MNYWLLLIPLLTAFSGWIILCIIRIMLFKPVEPVRFLGFTIQGLFPQQRQAMAIQLGRLAATEFAAFGSIQQKLDDPKSFESIKPLIEAHMDDFLRNRLKDQMPMISMFIGDRTIESLKIIFIKEIEDLFPRVMQQFSKNLRQNIDIEKIIASKLADIPPAKIEEMFSQNVHNGFQKASLFAVLVGLLIGIIQLLLVLWQA